MALGYGSGGGSFPSLRAISFSSLYAFFFAFFSLRYSNWKKDDSHQIKLTVFKLVHFYNLQVKDLIKLIKGHLQNRIITSATAIA